MNFFSRHDLKILFFQFEIDKIQESLVLRFLGRLAFPIIEMRFVILLTALTFVHAFREFYSLLGLCNRVRTKHYTHRLS